MNLMSHLDQLFSEKKIDELIKYIEGSAFPPDDHDYEAANELRQLKRFLVAELGECRELLEEGDWLRDDQLCSIKDAFYSLFAIYADLQCVVFVHMLEFISDCDQALDDLRQVETTLRTKMRLYLRKKTVRKNNAQRDALIIEVARESGLPSVNKQADYISENWDDTDLAGFKPLRSDRIRKILSS